MENEKLIQLGKLRQQVSENNESSEITLEYFRFLTSEFEMYEEFMKQAMTVKPKFSNDIKIQFTVGRHANVIYETFKNTKEKGIKRIAGDAKKIFKESYDRILTLKPKDDTELRMKLLVIRDRKLHDKALDEISRYEDEFGVDSQTVMMRADYFHYTKQNDEIPKLLPSLEKVTDKYKHSAIAYLDIYSASGKKKASDTALEHILESIRKHPDLDFPGRCC